MTRIHFDDRINPPPVEMADNNNYYGDDNDDLEEDEDDSDDAFFYSSDDDNIHNEGLVALVDKGTHSFRAARRNEARAADRLSIRLLAVENDSDEEDRILRRSLNLFDAYKDMSEREKEGLVAIKDSDDFSSRRKSFMSIRQSRIFGVEVDMDTKPGKRICTMILIALGGFATVVIGLFVLGFKVIGPPNQPVGPYRLVERQEGDNFFQFYTFYEGPDSVGSNGYLQYVSREFATARNIMNVSYEIDEIDLYTKQSQRRTESDQFRNEKEGKKPFIYMGSAPTPSGPRDSIRLEGIRRFNRGLFIIDVRHMPAGCGVWPAFWLTDEANWPVHGEIDIVEGVNYQNVAKTALHSTKGCSMEDIPLGTMTGEWDTAQGIPDAKTGIPDMTLRYARNCFVYDPHQWLNQGCVAVDKKGDSLGQPLNEKGGGVFALEWDPMNRHIRSYVFTPHTEMPKNLVDAIRTAHLDDGNRIMPDPDLWPTPYAYFALGDGTDCPASHFRQMRLVFNTAFCGSVSGNRFQLDCPKQAKMFDTCNEYIASQPEELNEAYWKIRGVFVYEREYERTWLH